MGHCVSGLQKKKRRKQRAARERKNREFMWTEASSQFTGLKCSVMIENNTSAAVSSRVTQKSARFKGCLHVSLSVTSCHITQFRPDATIAWPFYRFPKMPRSQTSDKPNPNKLSVQGRKRVADMCLCVFSAELSLLNGVAAARGATWSTAIADIFSLLPPPHKTEELTVGTENI